MPTTSVSAQCKTQTRSSPIKAPRRRQTMLSQVRIPLFTSKESPASPPQSPPNQASFANSPENKSPSSNETMLAMSDGALFEGRGTDFDMEEQHTNLSSEKGQPFKYVVCLTGRNIGVDGIVRSKRSRFNLACLDAAELDNWTAVISTNISCLQAKNEYNSFEKFISAPLGQEHFSKYLEIMDPACLPLLRFAADFAHFESYISFSKDAASGVMSGMLMESMNNASEIENFFTENYFSQENQENCLLAFFPEKVQTKKIGMGVMPEHAVLKEIFDHCIMKMQRDHLRSFVGSRTFQQLIQQIEQVQQRCMDSISSSSKSSSLSSDVEVLKFLEQMH